MRFLIKISLLFSIYVGLCTLRFKKSRETLWLFSRYLKAVFFFHSAYGNFGTKMDSSRFNTENSDWQTR